MKKALSVFLAMLMVMGTAVITANDSPKAKAEAAGGGYEAAVCGYSTPFTYEIENGEATITACDQNAQGVVEVPADFDGYPVKHIEGAAFFGCTKTSEIILPYGIETIGVGAFMRCTALAKINLPDSIRSIGKTAFYDSAVAESDSEYWTTYNNPTSSVKKIYVFRIDNHIIEVKGSLDSAFEIPEGVISIADRAFLEARGNTEIIIPSTLASFGKNTFRDSPTMTTEEGHTIFPDILKFTVSKENPYYSNDEDGVLYNKDKTVLVRYPSGKTDTEYTVADTVTEIADNAFCESYSLETVVMQEPLVAVGENAFYNCNALLNITLPDSVRRIKLLAFYGTLLYNKYAAGNFGTGILYIGNHLVDFYGFQTESIEIREGTITIADGSFGYLKNLSVNFPESLATVGDEAFSNRCSFENPLRIPKNLTYIGEAAFKEETVIYAFEVDEENPVYSSDEYGVLYNKNKTKLIRYPNASSLEEYTIPASVTEIEPYAFAGCKNLKNIIFAEDSEIAFIDKFVFLAASSLTDVQIPVTVKEIKEQAFEKSSLSTVYYFGTVEEWKAVICNDTTASAATVHCNWSRESLYTYTFSYMGVDYDESFAYGEKITLPEEIDELAVTGWSGDEIPGTMPARNLKSTAVTRQIAKAEDYDVTAYYSSEAFSEEASLDVAEVTGDREPGGVYMVDGEYYKQIGLYNIKAVNENGEVIQPTDGSTVTVRIAIPEEYKDRTEFVIYHRFVDGGREKLTTADGTITVENGCLIFNITSFSEFELMAFNSSIRISKLPDKMTYYYKTDDIDLTGIRLVLRKADGTISTVTNTSLLTVTGFDNTEIGKQTVTVRYGQYYDTFEVEVKYSFWQVILRVIFLGFLWY